MSSTSWWPSSDGAPPRHATRGNPDRPSDGAQVAAVARALGTPLTPWQQHVADVATERREDGSFEYQVVVVSVPRQCGKTALIRALGVHAAMLGRGVFYTAQTGKDARARWCDLVKALRVAAPFKAKMKSEEIKVALRGGSEHVAFPGGGVFQCFAPTVESLHGYTPARVFIDEAFAQTHENGDLLMGAIKPAQRTVRDKQVWIVSTRGTAASTWFHDWIDRATDGLDRVAVFDWGARDDQDPFDVDDIAAFHPAVGFEFVEVGATEGVVTTAADILAEAEGMATAEYVRAFGNRTTRLTNTLIEEAAFGALARDLEPPADLRTVTLAYDVDEHAAASAIVAVWETVDGPAAQLVRAGPGADWLVAGVDDLARDWRPARIVAASNGPGFDVTQQLIDKGLDVDLVNERDYAAAATALLVNVRDAGFVHDGSPFLAASVTGLAPRTAAGGDGMAFSRRHSVGSSAPGIALAMGLYRHRHTSTAEPKIRFATA